MMPYIVAMAYAVHVRMDARVIKSHSIADKAERKRYLERCHRTIDDFVKLLRSAILATVTDTSLLEIALDYYLALETYVMLILSLQASVKMTTSPEPVTGAKIKAWDDGLSKIR